MNPGSPTDAPSTPAGPRQPQIRVFDCHVLRRARGGLEALLLHRAKGKIYAGTWRMVGGKIRDGETAWAACLRELEEETKLVAEALWAVPAVNRFYEWQHDRINDIPVFAVLVDGDPTLDDEHDAWEWSTIAQASLRLPWPGQREGLQAAEHLLLHGHALWPYLSIPLAPQATP